LFGQTAASGCESFTTFGQLTPSPSAGCAGDFVAPKLMTTRPLLLLFVKVGTELVTKTSGKLHILMWLSAGENLNEVILCPYFAFSTLERSE
jgi:hypothetical protein